MASKKTSIIKISAVILIFLSIFFIRFGMLNKSSNFNGLDGYFYGLQAESFAKTGSLENPDMETGYYICGILSFIFNDSILGVKIWAALSFAIFCLSVFSLVYSLVQKNKFAYGLTAMIFSSGLFFATGFSINFINNLTGLFFLIFYIQVFISLFKSQNHLTLKIILLVLLFVLSCISHKVSFLYTLAFSVIYTSSKFTKYLKNKKVLIGSLIFLVLFSIAAIYIIIKQSARFANTFGLPSLPVFHKEFINALGDKGFYGAVEISIIFIFAWILFVTDIFLSKKISLISVLLIILFFPFWDLGTDMGYRMMMNGTILGIPLIFYNLSILFENKKTLFVNISLYILSGLSFISLCFTPLAYNPELDPPYDYYKTVIAPVELDDDTLLIAHLGLNHVYTYYKNLRDCMNWLPDYEISDDKVWRLAFDADYDRICSFFPEINPEDLQKEIKILNKSYILIKETLWQEYLNREEEDISETYKNWFNPYEVRPSYIRKLK